MSSRRDTQPPGRAKRLPAPPPLFRPAAANAPEPGVQALRRLLLERWPGRSLLGGLAVRLAVALVEWAVGDTWITGAIGILASLAAIVGGAVVVWWLFQRVRTRMLWRVRERLIISYLFIGVVPALLIAAFFLFGTALLVIAMSAYVFMTGVNGVTADARVIARSVTEELERSGGGAAVQEILDRHVARWQPRFPGLSIVVVPRQADVRRRPAMAAAPTSGRTSLVRAGAWSHLPPPDRIPAWIEKAGFEYIIAHGGAKPDEPLELCARVVAHGRTGEWSVVADVPLDEGVWAAIEETTGVQMIALAPGGTAGAAGTARSAALVTATSADTARSLVRYVSTRTGGRWVAEPYVFIPARTWTGSGADEVTAQIRVAPDEIYQRVSSAQGRPLGQSMSEVYVLGFGLIGFLFLVVEGAALAMGWALARSITGSVHALFTGTERLRLGDLGHRIPIRSRDQLGELAESFNAMTANIETLLEQAAEKRRLEEELRIAREIQMSLLPRQAPPIAGVSLAALCVPAREVGGDYYDFFTLGPRRLGVLVADVAGKGTSAALYMAELKGLMLSLSQTHESPRRLLVDVNRIIAENLDARSFITMTYAVVDLERRTLTYARAGHTPLVHRTAQPPAQACLIAPSGMVVGLKLDGLEHKFTELLEEQTVPFAAGDVFVLYTDGVSEAMNAEGDLYGEERLRMLVEEHGDVGAEGLRERIVRDVEAYVTGADPHDDMTLIVIAIDRAVTA
jgi:sigma-B regulation protein RsbU (phosphoserine phosphatase)